MGLPFMKKYLFLTLLPILAVADGHGTNYDIVWRTINFLIFFGIMYYLLKGPLKAMYNGRINAISARLEANQNLLKESKERKEQAKKEEAKMNVMGEIINVDVVKNIYLILLFILILKQSMMAKLQKVQMQIKFKMEKEEEDLEKIF